MRYQSTTLSKFAGAIALASLVVSACGSANATGTPTAAAPTGQTTVTQATVTQGPSSAASAAVGGVPCQLPQGKNGQFKVALASREILGDVNRDILTGASDEIKAAGGVITTTTDAGGDATKHNSNIENLITSGVDGIVIELGDVQQLTPIIASAKAKGILVATTLVGATAPDALTDVGYDDPIASAMMTRALFSSIGYKGDVYVFWVPGAPILETRKRVMEAIAADYPKIKLHEVASEFSAAKSLSQMNDILTANPQKGSIAGVWAAYDVLGSGPVEAITKAGRTEIKVASIDGDQIAFQELYAQGSPFIATVVSDMKAMGRSAADAVIKAACGRAAEVPVSGFTSMWLADRNNGVAAGELRWGSGLWSAIKLDKNQLIQQFPQTQDVVVVKTTLP